MDRGWGSIRLLRFTSLSGTLVLLLAGTGHAIGLRAPAFAGAAATYAIQGSVSPSTISTNKTAKVKVTGKVPAGVAISRMVLFRVNGETRTQVAELHDDGKNGDRRAQDLEYTCEVPLTESAVGELRFQIAAGTTGTEFKAVSRALYSAPLMVKVEAGQSGTSDGPNAGNNTASGFGALLGGLLQGLLNGDKSRPDKGKQVDNGGKTQPPAQATLQAKGLSLEFPPDWEYREEIVKMDGPIALRNFDEAQRGGIIPPGGAEIEITTSPADHVGLERMFSQDLGSVAATRTSVGNSPALRAEYSDEFGPELKYENAAVYVNRGAQIYKFFLSYRAGDSHRQDFLHTFDQLLASTRFEQE